MSSACMYRLQLCLEHLAQRLGEFCQIPVPALNLRFQTSPELATKHILLIGEVDDVLFHPREFGGKEPLELIAPARHLVA